MAASAVSAMPLHDVGAAGALPFNVEGQQPPATEDPHRRRPHRRAGLLRDDEDPAARRAASSTSATREEAPRTSVINETMARRYFPDRSPLGRRSQNPHGKSEVVGVVGDVRNQGLDREPKKQVYLPLRQSPTPGMALVARTERDPAGVWQHHPEDRSGKSIRQQPIYELSTMDQILARAVFLPRLSTTLLAMFALAALLLAALGIYGVLSYSVSQRTKEIGLRMALGARVGNTVAMIVEQRALVVIGGVVGLGCVGCRCRGRWPASSMASAVRPSGFRLAVAGAAVGGSAGQPAAGAACDARRPDDRARDQ